MPVLLSHYSGQTKNPRDKFVRAVTSFLNQTFQNKELIIVSDGCKESADICKRKWQKEMRDGLIILVEIPVKEPRELFVGSVRQAGIEWATGDLLANLDSDDTILPNHAHNIMSTFPETASWAYFNFYRKLDILKDVEELIDATPDLNGLCTANIVWKKSLDVSWNNCDGRQDNKSFTKQLIEKYPNFTKIYGTGYVVCNAIINYTENKQS